MINRNDGNLILSGKCSTWYAEKELVETSYSVPNVKNGHTRCKRITGRLIVKRKPLYVYVPWCWKY